MMKLENLIWAWVGLAIAISVYNFVQASNLFYGRDINPWHSVANDIVWAIAFVFASIFAFKDKGNEGKGKFLIRTLSIIMPFLFLISAIQTILYI